MKNHNAQRCHTELDFFAVGILEEKDNGQRVRISNDLKLKSKSIYFDFGLHSLKVVVDTCLGAVKDYTIHIKSFGMVKKVELSIRGSLAPTKQRANINAPHNDW